MAQSGKIDLKQVKGTYSVADIKFIDSREMDFANEFRTTYEVSFAIALTLLGNVISNFGWILLTVVLIFFAFGSFSWYRYYKKQKSLKKDSLNSVS